MGSRSVWRNSRHSAPLRMRTGALSSGSDRKVVQRHRGPSSRRLGTHLCRRESHSLNDQLGITGAARRNEQLEPVDSFCNDSWRKRAQAIRASTVSAIRFFIAISSSISRRARCFTVGLPTWASRSQPRRSERKKRRTRLHLWPLALDTRYRGHLSAVQSSESKKAVRVTVTNAPVTNHVDLTATSVATHTHNEHSGNEMGIKGLTGLISEHAPAAIQVLKFSRSRTRSPRTALTSVHQEYKINTLFGRKVAIDASMSIYQFLIAVRQQDGQLLQNDAGEITRYVRNYLELGL